MSHAMTIEDANMTGYDADEANPTKRTRTERRIDELKDVEEVSDCLMLSRSCKAGTLTQTEHVPEHWRIAESGRMYDRFIASRPIIIVLRQYRFSRGSS